MPAGKTLAAVMLAVASLGSVHAADHLIPCTELLSDYYTRVQTVMSQAAPGEALWKVTVFPQRGGKGEWSVRATRLDDGYALTVVRFDRSLWDASWSTTPDNQFKRDSSAARVEPSTTTRKISARLFNELDAQIRAAIENAGPEDNSLDDIVGMHNPEFRFEAAGSCANTRLSHRDSQIDRLINIVLMLCNPPKEEKILRKLHQTER